MCVQFIGDVQYIDGIPWVHRGDTMSTSGGVQYIKGISWCMWGYHDACGDIMSTSGDVQHIAGIPWVHWGDIMMHVVKPFNFYVWDAIINLKENKSLLKAVGNYLGFHWRLLIQYIVLKFLRSLAWRQITSKVSYGTIVFHLEIYTSWHSKRRGLWRHPLEWCRAGQEILHLKENKRKFIWYFSFPLKSNDYFNLTCSSEIWTTSSFKQFSVPKSPVVVILSENMLRGAKKWVGK